MVIVCLVIVGYERVFLTRSFRERVWKVHVEVSKHAHQGEKKRKRKRKKQGKKAKLTKSENTETHGLGFRKLPHEDKTGTASIWRARDKLSESKKGMKAKKEEKESICNLKALPFVMNTW